MKEYEGVFSVNGLFGTEFFESTSRVKLYTKSKNNAALVTKIMKAQIKDDPEMKPFVANKQNVDLIQTLVN